MNIELWLEGLLATLLVVAIFYCFRLNRRLERLRSAQSELRQLLADFGQMTAQAETSIDKLKSTTGELAQQLDERTQAARALNDELLIMTRSGSEVADRLETSLLRPKASPDRYNVAELDTARRSESERELLRTLQGAR